MQDWLGHANVQNKVRYTALRKAAPTVRDEGRRDAVAGRGVSALAVGEPAKAANGSTYRADKKA